MTITAKSAARVGAVVLAAALGLTACGTSGPQSSAEGNVTVWGLTQAPFNAVLDTSITSWNGENPDSQIDVEFFAGEDYKTKVRTAIGAGAGPTLIYGWGGGVLKSYVDAGEVLDLTPYLTEFPELRDRYIGAVADNGVIDGKTYALPNSYSQPVMFYYNKDVFDKVGAKPPTTWNEVMDLVPVFNDAGIAPFSLGGQSRWPELMWLSYLVDRIGGPEVFQAVLDNKPGAWSDPAVIEALTKIQELAEAGGFIDGFSSVAADTRADQALLHTGKAAMMVHLAGAYSGMKADAGDFVPSGGLGFMPFPSVEGGKGDPSNVIGNPSNFWSVSSKASDSQIDVAIDYLRTGMFNDTYVNDIVEAGSVPAIDGIGDKLTSSPDSAFLSNIFTMVSTAPHFQLSWDQAMSPAQADAMLTNLGLIFIGQQTPTEFAEIMNGTLGQ